MHKMKCCNKPVPYGFMSLPQYFSDTAQTNNIQGFCLYDFFFHSGNKQFCIVGMADLLTVTAQ